MGFKKGVVYFHIGTEKTGTTSLQECFFLNKEILLEKYRIFYPSTPGEKNHTDLPLYAYEEKLGDLPLRKGVQTEDEIKAFKKKFEADFLREIRPYVETGYNILLSSEHLSSRGGRTVEPKQHLVNLFIQQGMKVKVIIYLRPQEEFLLSTYSTRIKSGGTDEFNPLAYKKNRYDYLGILDNWAKVVGEESINVGIFQKTRLKHSLYHDFFSRLGISIKEDLKIPEKQQNKSLGIAQLEFLKAFNAMVPEYKDGKRNPLRGNVIEDLELLSEDASFMLSPELVKEIRTYFKKPNSVILKKYLHKEKALFDYRNMKPSSNSNQSLTQADIFSHLWIQQQKRINNNNKRSDSID